MRRKRVWPRLLTVFAVLTAVFSPSSSLAPVPARPALAAVTISTVPGNATGALALATALASDASLVDPGSTSFVTVPSSGTPNGTVSVGTGETFNSFPTHGTSFAILTSGDVTLANHPQNESTGSGEDIGGPNRRGDTDFDVTILKIGLNVPAGANCLTIDFKFFSEEFPEFVNTAYNDAFIAELDTSNWTTSGSTISAPNNFAFDPGGKVVSINSTGNTAMNATNAAPTPSVPTTYDGATPLLSAAKSFAASGSTSTHILFLSIFDQGDHILDSAVFLDNLQVFAVSEPSTQCTPGAKPKQFSMTSPRPGSTTTDPSPFLAASDTAADGSTPTGVQFQLCGPISASLPCGANDTTGWNDVGDVDTEKPFLVPVSPALGVGGDYKARARATFSGGATALTDPVGFAFDRDSDRDGISDSDETARQAHVNPTTGLECAAGSAGCVTVDLPGADPGRPDVFVQIDWMADGSHTHQLSCAAVQKVANAFKSAPVTTTTTIGGTKSGVNLHVDAGPGSSIPDPQSSTACGSWPDGKARALNHQEQLGSTDAAQNYDWGPFDQIKNGGSSSFRNTGRPAFYRYFISLHKYGGGDSSGTARVTPIPGATASDGIIALGAFANGVGSDNEKAGTFMHELGHMLGLRHGGNQTVNFKPNYLSVMNYAFQMGGVIKNGVAGNFDYSGRVVDPLSETGGLTESPGLKVGGVTLTGFGTKRWCQNLGAYGTASDASKIDWNCDRDTRDNPVASADINGDGLAQSSMTGFDDWANLKYLGGEIGLKGFAPALPAKTVDPESIGSDGKASASNPLTPDKAEKILPAYKLCLLYDPQKVWKAGSTVPIRLQLCDNLVVGQPGSEENLSSPTITLRAQRVRRLDDTVSSSEPVDSGNANPDNDFRYDSALDGYIFNLSTKGFSTGTHELTFTVGAEEYKVRFEVRQ